MHQIGSKDKICIGIKKGMKRLSGLKFPTSVKQSETLVKNYLEAIYKFIHKSSELKSPTEFMDEMARMAKSFLDLDLFIVYTRRVDGMLEPAFARSGQDVPSAETDLSWGDTVARRTVDGGESVHRIEIPPGKDENNQKKKARQTLSLPLLDKGKLNGALVLIRNHGLEFQPDELEFAEFLAYQTSQQLSYLQITNRLEKLEGMRHISAVQDDFIALISHELLTPLGFIKGYATTLLRDDITWEPAIQREFLSIIDDESDRLKHLIEDLLDSSRLQEGTLQMDFQPIKLDLLLKDITLRARSRNEKLDVVLQIDTSGLHVIGDPTRLAQVMDNLFSNAIKYAPHSPIRIHVRSDQKLVYINFIDYGPGIPPEYLDNLFQRFFRVPNTQTTIRGTGLGLFICRLIIVAHKGEISVKSSPGEGAIFIITLPLFTDQEKNS